MAKTSVKVLWIHPHPDYAYFPGDICQLDEDKALSLAEGKFLEIKDDLWEPEKPKKIEDPSVRVLFLKPHPSFGYSEGDVGLVTPENLIILKEGDYVLVVPEEVKMTLAQKLRYKLNK